MLARASHGGPAAGGAGGPGRGPRGHHGHQADMSAMFDNACPKMQTLHQNVMNPLNNS